MIKVFTALPRKAGLSREEFQAQWLALAPRRAATLPGLRRYVTYATLLDEAATLAVPKPGEMRERDESGRAAFDGVSAAWFDDYESFRAALDDDVLIDADAAEADSYVDGEGVQVVLTGELVIHEPTPRGTHVFVELLRGAAGVDHATFKRRWLHHATMAEQFLRPGMLDGYIQNHTLAGAVDLGPAEPYWHGITTAYYPNAAGFRAVMSSDTMEDEVLEDEEGFLDHRACSMFLTRRATHVDLVR